MITSCEVTNNHRSYLPLSLSPLLPLPLTFSPSPPLPLSPHSTHQAYTAELEKMEDPASVTPIITQKQSRMRELAREVTDLTHEMQSLGDKREEYIQHMRRE